MIKMLNILENEDFYIIYMMSYVWKHMSMGLSYQHWTERGICHYEEPIKKLLLEYLTLPEQDILIKDHGVYYWSERGKGLMSTFVAPIMNIDLETDYIEWDV